MKKVNLDHPWFDEFHPPHPLPVVQQSIEFIQSMRSELRAAREVVEQARKTTTTIKKILDIADTDLVVDVNGHMVKIDMISEILGAVDKYDKATQGVGGEA